MNLIESLKMPTDLQNSDWKSFAAEPRIAICTICQGTVKAFLELRRNGMSIENIQNKIIKLCVLLNIQTERVCQGVVESNAVKYIYAIKLI